MSETSRPCPDDLLALGRRRPLSDLERRVVASHLARCEPCRASGTMAALLHEGELDEGEPRDLELIERVAERASAALAARSARRRRPVLVWAAAALALTFVATGAFALIGRPTGLGWLGPRARSVEPDRPGRSHRTERAGVRPPEGVSAQQPPPDEPARVSMADAAAARPSRRRLPSGDDGARPGTPTPAPANAPTAAALFAEANATRRAGDLRHAVALYQQLRLRFPEAAEARVASISLGDLLLNLDAPARALAAFDAYLAELPSGSLREEALFGRARCLRTLGRGAAEEETWKLLRQEFPGSAYEPLARRRLEDLRR